MTRGQGPQILREDVIRRRSVVREHEDVVRDAARTEVVEHAGDRRDAAPARDEQELASRGRRRREATERLSELYPITSTQVVVQPARNRTSRVPLDSERDGSGGVGAAPCTPRAI